MKASTRWVVGLVSVWIVVVAVVTSAQPSGTALASARQSEKPPQDSTFEPFQRADRVMSLSCSVSGCHTLRVIDISAMDREGWTKTVDAMIAKGAKIDSAEDKTVLIERLVRDHGPLPEGDGKKLLLTICTICHDLQRVRSRLYTPDGWKGLLEEMIVGGAPLTDESFPILLAYLSKNFRPTQ